MTDVTMIGLGAMGSSLARAFLGAGHEVTVWNRTASKMEPLSTLGASTASSIVEAVEASSIIVVCIDNYKYSRQLISENDLGQYLSARTLVQLSTGTPKEAHKFEEIIRGFDCEYIDGAIICYPEGIGDEDAKILLSGPEETYARCQSVLNCLGGDLCYLGSTISGAAALDMALLTHDLCSYFGVIHGANICESENISIDELASMFPNRSIARELAEVIHSGNYNNPGATLTVWDSALQRIQTQAKDADINCEVPDFISCFFKRAIEVGYGEEDVASIVKVLRGSNVSNQKQEVGQSEMIISLEQQLININRQFDKALESGDAVGAASHFTDHGVCISPDMETARGQIALTKLFQSLIDTGITNAHDDNHEIEHCGDVVLMSCTFESEYLQSDGSIVPESGKALQVFVCTENDAWKIHHLCFAIDSVLPG